MSRRMRSDDMRERGQLGEVLWVMIWIAVGAIVGHVLTLVTRW